MNSSPKVFGHLIKLALVAWPLLVQAKATEFKALVQTGVVSGDDRTSWQDGGRSFYRYSDDGLVLTQLAASLNTDLTSTLSANLTANASSEHDFRPGLSQAYLHYRPLSGSDYRWRYKLGAFYPRLSFENVDIAWLSPYNYTNSAINAWFGEVLRIQGVEVSLERSGRKLRSPHSFALVASIYGGHDTFGIELSQRGFNLHDRQTVLGEDLQIPNPSSPVVDGEHQGFLKFDPFEEIDDRPGYYLGAHWDYKNKSQLRYYFYDNRADSSKRGSTVKAWDTWFHHLAWQYRFSRSLRVNAQWLFGETDVNKKAILTEYQSGFVMVSYLHQDKHRISSRLEFFETKDIDGTPGGNVESKGDAWTTAWRYDFDDHWQVGVEYSVADVELPAFSNVARISETQSLFQWIVQYRL